MSFDFLSLTSSYVCVRVCVCACDFVLLVMIKERGRRKEDGGTVFILLSSNCLVSGGFLFLSSFSPLFMSCYISCLYYGIVLCRFYFYFSQRYTKNRPLLTHTNTILLLLPMDSMCSHGINKIEI